MSRPVQASPSEAEMSWHFRRGDFPRFGRGTMGGAPVAVHPAVPAAK